MSSEEDFTSCRTEKKLSGISLHHGVLDESIMIAGKRRDVMTRNLEHLALKIIEFFAAVYAKEKVLMQSLSSPFSFPSSYFFPFWEVVRKTTASLTVIKDCLDGGGMVHLSARTFHGPVSKSCP